MTFYLFGYSVRCCIKRRRADRIDSETYLTRRIGNTVYKVKISFSETGTETMEDKILRMIRNEAVTTGELCGTIEAPQMSRQSERSA